jgi:UDP-glucose 4-epimerase
VRVLFTGASSFTGCWFVRELAAAGHDVVATFRRRPEEYPDMLRRRRVQWALEVCQPLFGCAFGDERFLEVIREDGPWHLLCHHAAEVTDYKSPNFDVTGALRNNTHRLSAVLDALVEADCRRVLLTGSVFENDEGAGSEGLPAFSPYGLSKSLTAKVFEYYTAAAGIGLGKFVIPNPFGPYEEPRFTAYLMRSWKEGKTPAVNTPAYVRDNIHVTLLAKAYAAFAAAVPERGFRKLNPSGYVETQGAFAMRFAAEMGPRLGLNCPLQLKTQVEFSEPRVRINTDIPDTAALGWDETRAWDEIAAYYRGSGA